MADSLAIILTEAPGARFEAAMELARVWNALDRPVGVLLKAGAISGLGGEAAARIMGMAVDEGVRVGVCQTAMDALGFTADMLPDGVIPLGLMAFLLELPGAQVMVV